MISICYHILSIRLNASVEAYHQCLRCLQCFQCHWLALTRVMPTKAWLNRTGCRPLAWPSLSWRFDPLIQFSVNSSTLYSSSHSAWVEFQSKTERWQHLRPSEPLLATIGTQTAEHLTVKRRPLSHISNKLKSRLKDWTTDKLWDNFFLLSIFGWIPAQKCIHLWLALSRDSGPDIRHFLESNE